MRTRIIKKGIIKNKRIKKKIMKNRKWLCQMLALSVLWCLAVSQPVAADDEILYLGSVLEIENRIGERAAAVYIKTASEEDWAENRLKVRSRFEAEKDTIYDLKLVTEGEKTLFFYNLPLAEIKTLTLFSEESRTYVRYENLSSGEVVDTQDYALAPLEEPAVLYTNDYLNVRALPQLNAEIYEVLSPVTEAQAYAEADGWYLIRHQDGYGYICGDYVADSKEEAEKAVREREQTSASQEQKAVNAEAQTVAQPAATGQPAAKEQKKSGSRNEKGQQDALQPSGSQTNLPQADTSQTGGSQTNPSQADASQPGGSQTNSPQTDTSQPGGSQTNFPEVDSSDSSGGLQPAVQIPTSRRYEVSRENVASCEDPDHGTTYITYSDGSVQTIDY